MRFDTGDLTSQKGAFIDAHQKGRPWPGSEEHICYAPLEGNVGAAEGCGARATFSNSVSERQDWAKKCGVQWQTCGVTAPCKSCGKRENFNLRDAVGTGPDDVTKYEIHFTVPESWQKGPEENGPQGPLKSNAHSFMGAEMDKAAAEFCCAACKDGEKSTLTADKPCMGWVYFPPTRACYLKYTDSKQRRQLEYVEGGDGVLAGIIQNDCDRNLLFTKTPFLMTHDSATGHFGNNDIMDGLKMAQTPSPVNQLNCGARALDLRLRGGECHQHHDDYGRSCELEHSDRGGAAYKVRYHHGSIDVDNSLGDDLESIMAWAAEHPTEMVVLLVSHCHRNQCYGNCDHDENEDCIGRYMEPIVNRGIKLLGAGGQDNPGDCASITGLSLFDAKGMARLPSGGMVLAQMGDGNCYDSKSPDEYGMPSGYSDPQPNGDGWHVVPWLLGEYTEKAMSGYHLDGVENYKSWHPDQWPHGPYALQLLLQQPSDPLNKCSHSIRGCAEEYKVNLQVANAANSRTFATANLVEINDVCGYGYDIAKALGHTVTQKDVNTCNQHCDGNFHSNFCSSGGSSPKVGFSCSPWHMN